MGAFNEALNGDLGDVQSLKMIGLVSFGAWPFIQGLNQSQVEAPSSIAVEEQVQKIGNRGQCQLRRRIFCLVVNGVEATAIHV